MHKCLRTSGRELLQICSLLFSCRVATVCEKDIALGSLYSPAPKRRKRPLAFNTPHIDLTTFGIATRCRFPFIWQISAKNMPSDDVGRTVWGSPSWNCWISSAVLLGFPYGRNGHIFQNWFLHSFSISFSWLAKSKSNVWGPFNLLTSNPISLFEQICNFPK